jgi:hypothetical protein
MAFFPEILFVLLFKNNSVAIATVKSTLRGVCNGGGVRPSPAEVLGAKAHLGFCWPRRIEFWP